ncbi:unnamed protein product [Notodromas monacha]|uniref:Patched n=1 Tax=Notodromas monacha TaxID=399045 RepID=A0A7R9GH99_9CRUS|nr:unnamed protein product [Notodromas monacha]CAG0921089.1 unnamed protein product [Notodromas monacha]
MSRGSGRGGLDRGRATCFECLLDESLQNAFDADWAAGHITQESWNANASAEGILAYKLLVQTGHVDDPVDKSQVTTARLVDERGVIRSTGFYNYLSAWVSNDALAYSYSDGALSPSPRVWYHDPYDTELKIPKSNSLDMSLMPFQLVALDSTEALTDTVGQIRAICDSFRARGLPTFPAGIPFTFWEQYTGLRPQMAASMGAAAACVFVTIAVGLGSPWAGLLTAASVALTVLCLWGTMSMLLGLQLSAVPAALLVCSVGLVARPAVQVLAAHASAIGGRARRTAIALDAVGPAVVHAHLAVLCGAAMLALAPFDFIVRHFFCVIVVLVMLSLLHSLLLLPVLLTLAGPPAEVSPVDGTCLLPYPSPDLRRPQERAPAGYHKSSAVPGRSMRVVAPPGGLRRGGNLYPPPPPGMREERQRSGSSRMSKRAAAAAAAAAATRGSQISLSTITEEPSSLTSSHEIVLQPELVLETSLNGPLTASTSSSSSAASSSCASSSSADDCCGKRLEDVSPAASVSSGVHFTTRVTATAKFKVELHSRPGCVTASSTTSSSKRRSRTSGIERVSISQPTSTSSSVSSTRSECESSFDPYMSSSSSPSPPPYRRSNDGV